MSNQIKTIEELRAYMESVKGEPVDDSTLIWFFCICNARLISNDMSIKDIANMLKEGMPKAQLNDVQEYIDTFCSATDLDDDTPEYIVETVKELDLKRLQLEVHLYYNIQHETIAKLSKRISEIEELLH